MKLLFSLPLLLSLASADNSSDFEADADSQVIIQSRIANLTQQADITFGLTEANKGQWSLEVHVVNFDKCTRKFSDWDDFYKGLIINNWGYRNILNKGEYDDYSAVGLGRLEDPECRSSGVSFNKNNQKTDLHTWEWIKFPSNYDVRQRSTKLDVYVYNALPIIYLPLMSYKDAPELRTNYAYMLYLVPKAEQYPSAFIRWFRYVNLLKYRTDSQPSSNEMEVSKWTIDFSALYNKMVGTTFRWTTPESGFFYGGIVKTVKTVHKVDFGADKNQLSLVSTAAGLSGQFMCGFASVPDVTSTDFFKRLGKLLPFVNA